MAAVATDLGFRSVHRLLLEVGALGQHSSVVLVADVLVRVVQPARAGPGRGPRTGMGRKGQTQAQGSSGPRTPPLGAS